jgi:V/A-type H+-transporting ATPase subunit I
MIAPMARVRILGPRDRLEGTLEALQDTGMVHLTRSPPVASLRPIRLTAREQREQARLAAIQADLSAVARQVGADPSAEAGGSAPGEPGNLARWARTGHQLRRELECGDATRRLLEEERAELRRFERFVDAFRALRAGVGHGAALHAYQLVLRAGDQQAAASLRAALGAVIGDQFILETAVLEGGEVAALLLVPASDQARVERILAQAGVHELPVPASLGTVAPADTATALAIRRQEVDTRLAVLEARREAIRRVFGGPIQGAMGLVLDRRQELEAREQALESARSFVVEGWVPAGKVAGLEAVLRQREGDTVVVEEVAREAWAADDAPVVLQNPRLFRPFEVITRMMPLPSYGTIDPTPFVAVFFPAFFGLILGDVAYGLLLALLSGLLHWTSRPDTPRRAIARVGGACAAFTIGFGILFGEFLGDLGGRWFGMPHLLFDREEALLPFLGLAVAIGLVHVTLGLVLGVVNTARGHPRQALGRGLALVMLALVLVVFLAAMRILPGAFFTPAVIVLLVVFPVLVVVEGIIAPIEFLSTVSNILSYARIMALGTASVMMAVVANRLVGAFGGAVIGILFGLLFHLVNFALGVFAPVIHGLRLHYVEFFGKFYSPGGQQYTPFARRQTQRPAPR